MKYVIVQGDGMADHPLEELSGMTPLEAADTPHMDEVASAGELGVVNTIPPDMPPGSSVGNMSLMGLDPGKYFSGRAPLEARGRGIRVRKDDVVFRCNLVSLGESGSRRIMEDYSGGHPSTEEAEQYVKLLDEELGVNGFKFYSGVSYRNLLVWEKGRNEIDPGDITLTPPHDITGEPVEEFLPEGAGAERMKIIQDRAEEILKRESKSFNGIWLWGAGVKPDLPSFQERYGLSGAVVSAVDLIKGLGAFTGLSPVKVEGATGSIDTDYAGKVRAVKENLEDDSLLFLHVEAPDEASHAGDLELKIEAIELIDERILEPLVNYLSGEEDSRLLLVTDHITGIESKTHERGPVPFAIREFSRSGVSPWRKFAEREASRSGEVLKRGAELVDLLIEGR
ncbi:MAG: cofactor-independent phosphoglycerate mutase [Candidatus Bipolaricaulota bacterium]|nr:cofactor-independent phosphoglycerate mutase [Candidatus Bipolaricaulota bacterium]MBS3791308.1 cofactor-independent phosphoglycerate mutase [Candidatus Bipolaricaulota bacterium]